jgi:hypothetical protein
MKKFILVALVVVALLAVPIRAHAEKASFGATVTTAGEGSAKCFYNDDGTITLYAEETAEPFVFWNIKGDYEIVKGDYEDLFFTIRPLSRIKAIASYESAMPHKVVMTSPQTGDKVGIALICLITAALVACIAILKLRR